MNEAILCPNCHFSYSVEDHVPLVLKCGHSLCMLCALATLSTAERRLCCLRCPFIQPASMAAIKDLPVNRTLLEAFGLRSDSQMPTQQETGLDSPGKFQSLRSLDQFLTSPARLLFREDWRSPEDDRRALHTPQQSPWDVRLTSPTTVAVKCRRSFCGNDRYYFNGQVFDYCSIKCEEQDTAQHRLF